MRIIIVKTSSFGDILHAYPVIGYLKEKFPSCTIDWIVEKRCRELVEAHPDIDQCLVVDTKLWRKGGDLSSFWTFKKALQRQEYDLLFDLQGNIKSSFFTFLAKAKRKIGFGFKTAPEKGNVLVTTDRFDPPKGKNIREDLLFLAQSFFQEKSFFETKPVFLKSSGIKLQEVGATLVCPGSNWENKCVSLQFLKKMVQSIEGPVLYSWGTEKERQVCEELAQIRGRVLQKQTLPELQNIMRQVSLVIAMDSLPLHLAGTCQTPTYAFFGPSSCTKYNPVGSQHRAMQGSCPYGVKFEKRCPRLRTCKTGECIKTLNPVLRGDTFT
jgi:heptosyltransferase-1